MSAPEIDGADFYSVDADVETLNHGHPDEAIEDLLSGLGITHWPETVTVYGYRRVKFEDKRDRYAGWVLEWALELLDENLGDPESPTEPTPEMEAAARAFLDAIAREYKVWTCERHGEPVTVNVMEWVRENRPDLLEEKP